MDAIAQLQEGDVGLVGEQVQNFRPKRAIVDVKKRKRDGKTKAAWPSTAWIEQKNSITGLDRGFVRVTTDDYGNLGSAWIDLEVLQGVNEVEEVSVELDGLSFGKCGAGPVGVDIAADGGKRSDCAKGLENSGIPDIAGMQDVVGLGQRCQCFGTKQAVRVREDADQHKTRVDFDWRRFISARVRAGFVGLAGRGGHPQ